MRYVVIAIAAIACSRSDPSSARPAWQDQAEHIRKLCDEVNEHEGSDTTHEFCHRSVGQLRQGMSDFVKRCPAGTAKAQAILAADSVGQLDQIFVSSKCGDLQSGVVNEAMAKMVEFKDQMCACKDRDCVMHVSDDMAKWAEANKDKADVKPAEDEMKRAMEISKQLSDCMQKAMMASDPAASDTIAKMSEFKDQMCACKDKSCATRVSDEMARWAETNKDKPPSKPSDDDLKKGMEISKQLSDCMQKAVGPPTIQEIE